MLALCAAASAQEGAADENAATRPPAIDAKPLQDVAAEAAELVRQGRLGPGTRVDVTAKGERNDDGSLKPETVVLDWNTGSDEVVASLAQRFVLALSASKIFSVLEGAKEVSIRLRLDETNAQLGFSADLPSAERARQLSEGYGAMLNLAAMSKQGTRYGEIYKSLRIDSDGKHFAFTFEMQREALGRIVDEVLARRAERAGV